jgi:K+-transporting ATPase ATPase C chain
MKSIIRDIRIAVISTLTFAALVGGIYPVLVWGIAQAALPEKADGSLIMENGEIVGSRLLGQGFTGKGYFHPRPSAAGKGYEGTSSGGSNFGPLSRRLIETVGQRVEAYRRDNDLRPGIPVPPDAVTASASGLDPHISLANALLQAPRVAKARGLSEETLHSTIMANTQGRDLLIIGEPRVNVLLLNLELDGRGDGG